MRKLLFTIMFFAASCGGPKISGNFPSGCRPHDLTVEVDSGKMTISWKKDCPRTISGYNIYISESPLLPKYEFSQIPPEIKPFNLQPFPGDTNPDDFVESFEATGLSNGIRYHVSVRILMPDGIQSRPAKEVLAVCGPTGEIDISVRFKSEQDGYSFHDELYVRADNEQNDIYYYNAEGVDFLASPIKLNGFLKNVKLMHLPFSGNLEEVKRKTRQLDLKPSSDRLPVITGDWVWAMGPDGTNTLIKVIGFADEGEVRKIRLFYLHSVDPEEPFL